MKFETVYKVTTVECKSCASSFENFLPQLVVNYSIEHFALPPEMLPNSGLFCFKDLVKAQRFICRNKCSGIEWVIWEAVGGNVRPKKAFVTVNSFFRDRVFNFWKSLQSRFGFRVARSSYGYYVADCIKLTKLVVTGQQVLARKAEALEKPLVELNKPVPVAQDLPFSENLESL